MCASCFPDYQHIQNNLRLPIRKGVSCKALAAASRITGVSTYLQGCKAEDWGRPALEALYAICRHICVLKGKGPRMSKPAAQRLLTSLLPSAAQLLSTRVDPL